MSWKYKAICYASLIPFYMASVNPDPQEFMAEMNEFSERCLQYNAELDGGKRGQPPAIHMHVAKRHDLERFGARVDGRVVVDER
jgi:hypothetical protein